MCFIYITLGRNFQLRVGDRVNSWDLVFKFETADIYIYNDPVLDIYIYIYIHI